MSEVLFVLFERIGLLLMFAYLITRIPHLKTFLYRKYHPQSQTVFIIVFFFLSIVSTHLSIAIVDGEILKQILWFKPDKESIVLNLSLIVVFIAGLWGGVLNGGIVGFFNATYYSFFGLEDILVFGITSMIVGIGSGFLNKCLSTRRMIKPIYALFLGFIPSIVYLTAASFFVFDEEPLLTNVTLGIPYIFATGAAISIFVSIIHIIYKEEGHEIIIATNQAFHISEEALPILKYDSRQKISESIADLLYKKLDVSGVAVTKQDKIIAMKGVSRHFYQVGDTLKSQKAKEALRTRKMQTVYYKHEPVWKNHYCPYEAALIIPIIEPNDTVSLIKFYFRKESQISPVFRVIAQGIGQLFSNQLKLKATEKLREQIWDAELRSLQAQINPHFLFNTLHLIASLFRSDPIKARTLTIKLAKLMRFNLDITENKLITLEDELANLKAYNTIVETRFSNRLKIHYHLDRSIDYVSVMIPPSTIQPLVENAIQHGLKQVTENGEIEIRIERKNDRVFISVTDNGTGFDEMANKQIYYKQPSKKQYSGVGLYNVNHRLINLLDKHAKLHVENLPEGGSKVYFSIPLKYQANESDVYENI